MQPGKHGPKEGWVQPAEGLPTEKGQEYKHRQEAALPYPDW